MPVKIGLVINRGQYNQTQNQTQKSHFLNKNVENQLAAAAAPAPVLATNTPPGINLRRVMNAPKTGCKSCGS